MAAAFFNDLADPAKARAISAGTEPATHVHPEVVAVMRELGVDLEERVPRLLEREDAEWADVVVTMGCGDACPYIPGKRYVDWDLQDPAGQPIAAVREIRDDIDARVRALVDELAEFEAPV
jgi:arsenate reductase